MRDEDSDEDVYIPDEAKYNALVESRKNRRAVSSFILWLMAIKLSYLNLNDELLTDLSFLL